MRRPIRFYPNLTRKHAKKLASSQPKNHLRNVNVFKTFPASWESEHVNYPICEVLYIITFVYIIFYIYKFICPEKIVKYQFDYFHITKTF